MSRTDAHTPHHVHARNDHLAEIDHNGCHLDPSEKGRFIRWDEVEVDDEARWRPQVIAVDNIFTFKTFVYDAEAQRYVNEATGEAEAFPRRGHVTYGAQEVYGPATFLEQVPVYEVVNCDVDHRTSYRSCLRRSEKANVETFGYGHKCHWPDGLRRELWYKPERQQGRQFCREAVALYNTYGEAPEDEPHVPSSPRGLWGGGWVD